MYYVINLKMYEKPSYRLVVHFGSKFSYKYSYKIHAHGNGRQWMKLMSTPYGPLHYHVYIKRNRLSRLCYNFNPQME